MTEDALWELEEGSDCWGDRGGPGGGGSVLSPEGRLGISKGQSAPGRAARVAGHPVVHMKFRVTRGKDHPPWTSVSMSAGGWGKAEVMARRLGHGEMKTDCSTSYTLMRWFRLPRPEL